jgi:hypothetical protein
MPKHACHCPHCNKTVAPKFFGCGPCWFSLPKPMRDAIWASYRPGQEVSKNPSHEYLAAAQAAVEYLRENHKHS